MTRTNEGISIFTVHLKRTASFISNTNIVRSPQDAATIAKAFFEHQYNGYMPDREVLVSLYLNTKNCVSGIEVISIGSLNASIAHPREIYKGAVLHNAASVILAHNHPSGNTDPSPEDIELTERVSEAGNILGIDLLDHVIIGEGDGYTSLKENGLM